MSLASSPPQKPDHIQSISRRKWLQRLGATVGAGIIGAGTYASQVELHWVEVVRQTMGLPNLPSELEGKTLVQISDIHIGDNVDDEYLISWFQRVAEWNSDIVVFTGDFLTLRHDKSLPLDKMNRVLASFPRGRLATIGVLGNHDYGYRWRDLKVANTVESIAKNAGISILRNQSVSISGLQFVGFDEFLSPNFGGESVLKNANLETPTIVLCHNPDVVDLPVWFDYQGWILSGHTHGGQCKPPFLAPPLLPISNKRYSAGLIQLEDGRRLYVNRALGHSLPVRFNVRPEITVFSLACEAPSQPITTASDA